MKGASLLLDFEAAKALGIAIPQTLLSIPTEVIE